MPISRGDPVAAVVLRDHGPVRRVAAAVVGVVALTVCVVTGPAGGPVAAGAVAARQVAARQVAAGNPPCSTAEAPAPMLHDATTRFVSGPVAPFGVAVSRDNRHVVVADAHGGLFLYSLTSSKLTAERSEHLGGQSPLGLALTPNGRYLIAANGGGALVFDMARIDADGSSSSWRGGTWRSSGQGAIEAAVAPGGHFVFVTLEDSDDLAVFNLQKALSHGFGPSDLVGTVPLDIAPVGMAVSPGGRYLYATSELKAPRQTEGVLTTIDIGEATRSPRHAVVSTVAAGCSPVRVVATKSSVFVTARGSDAVLKFSAADLVTHPGAALEGEVRVGEAPVGLALVDHDRTLVVADSNRFRAHGARAGLAVVTGTSHGDLTLAGYLKSGSFPRDMAVSPDGKTLVVSNYGSGQVETVGVGHLP
jgi:DNA-binding beta-propeller fold protein YncE